jgi:acetyl esterase
LLGAGVAAPLIVVPALGVAGTFLHGVPYVGVAAGFVPPVMSWVIIAALAGGALALSLLRRHRGPLAAVLVVVAVLTVVGGSVVSVRMTTAVESAGADIDLAKTLDVVSERSATPDADATYTTFDGEPLRLSIYRPRATVTPAPVLVFVHGGGFVAGDRDAHGTDLRWFAEGGWLVVSVDYALSSPDRHLWDVVQPQLGCALTWVTANAHRYGGDPARLSLSGDSAGGNLAINTTYTGGSPVEFPQRYAAITSATHVGATAPPTLILFGAADHLVPTAGTYRFADLALAAGVDVELVAVPYADHVFDARPGSVGQQGYRQLTAKWLRDHGQAP